MLAAQLSGRIRRIPHLSTLPSHANRDVVLSCTLGLVQSREGSITIYVQPKAGG